MSVIIRRRVAPSVWDLANMRMLGSGCDLRATAPGKLWRIGAFLLCDRFC
jgi:hypothetical protein